MNNRLTSLGASVAYYLEKVKGTILSSPKDAEPSWFITDEAFYKSNLRSE